MGCALPGYIVALSEAFTIQLSTSRNGFLKNQLCSRCGRGCHSLTPWSKVLTSFCPLQLQAPCSFRNGFTCRSCSGNQYLSDRSQEAEILLAGRGLARGYLGRDEAGRRWLSDVSVCTKMVQETKSCFVDIPAIGDAGTEVRKLWFAIESPESKSL